MLKLTDIRKDYITGDSVVHALKGVSLQFRKSEFVSILGQSGCGKTTLLNIVGGLDQYTSGDLVINGKSTKEYGDREWDTYRNHSVGFVFQSYNLIPHQTVLANVELALTLSGISKEERKKRAIEALETVGLGEQIKKRPNQLSGGQMQRVAIARALVNNPDILLADEPTGALDSETSVQIMELLKAISNDKLIIMVTHNPELAKEYSTRIINLLDGEVVSDSNPYNDEIAVVESKISAKAYKKGAQRELMAKKLEYKAVLSGIKGADSEAVKAKKQEIKEQTESKKAEIDAKYRELRLVEQAEKKALLQQNAEKKAALKEELSKMSDEEAKARLLEIKQEKAKEKKELKAKRRAERKTSMSFITALSLSLNNLLTKKGRTFLTAFAGSIGIIGIALILSVSSGVSAYITSVEEGTMSSYPLEIKENTMDVMTLLGSLMDNDGIENPEPGKVYSHDVLATMFDSANKGLTTNNLVAFKEFIDQSTVLKENTSDIKYVYKANLNTYKVTEDVQGAFYKPTLDGIAGLLDEIGMGALMGSSSSSSSSSMMSSMMGGGAFKELIGDSEYIESQYNKLYGKYPTQPNEVVLIVDKNQQISDFTLYTLGLKDTQELKDYIIAMRKGEEYTIPSKTFTYEEICGYKFKVIPDSEKYKLEDGKIVERDTAEINAYLRNAMTLEIVGILTPSENASGSNVIGAIGYTSELMNAIIDESNENALIEAQKQNTTTDLMTGMPFAAQLPDLTVVRRDMGAILAKLGLDVTRMSDAQLLSNLKTFLATEPTLAGLLSFQKAGGVGMAPYGGYTLESMSMIKLILSQIKDVQIKTMADNIYAACVAGYDDDSNFLKLVNALLYEDLTYTPAEAHESALEKIGYVDYNKPNEILIYPKDFDSKQIVKDEIEKYNKSQSDKNNEITYSDTVALLMSSVTTIIDAITYVLVAFVAISLIVSSIMIGIITYISVLERTKEIGILRAIGASKKDISRVFNAETLIVGFAAGLIGILVSLFFIVIINIILFSLTELETLKAVLPVGAAVVLVLISMGLTLVAGLFPAKVAAKKDPVIALRTE